MCIRARLKHNCAGFVCYGIFEIVHIVGVYICESLCKREKVVVEHILSCSRKCGYCSAVERCV